MNFSIGEIAILLKSENRPETVGCEVTILSNLHMLHFDDGDSYMGYSVEFVDESLNTHMNFGSPPQDLKKLDDGHEESSWENCVWKPKEKVNDKILG